MMKYLITISGEPQGCPSPSQIKDFTREVISYKTPRIGDEAIEYRLTMSSPDLPLVCQDRLVRPECIEMNCNYGKIIRVNRFQKIPGVDL